jgi:hypothetical protein
MLCTKSDRRISVIHSLPQKRRFVTVREQFPLCWLLGSLSAEVNAPYVRHFDNSQKIGYQPNTDDTKSEAVLFSFIPDIDSLVSSLLQ